jgi:hypothetical protein
MQNFPLTYNFDSNRSVGHVALSDFAKELFEHAKINDTDYVFAPQYVAKDVQDGVVIDAELTGLTMLPVKQVADMLAKADAEADGSDVVKLSISAQGNKSATAESLVGSAAIGRIFASGFTELELTVGDEKILLKKPKFVVQSPKDKATRDKQDAYHKDMDARGWKFFVGYGMYEAFRQVEAK